MNAAPPVHQRRRLEVLVELVLTSIVGTIMQEGIDTRVSNKGAALGEEFHLEQPQLRELLRQGARRQ